MTLDSPFPSQQPSPQTISASFCVLFLFPPRDLYSLFSPLQVFFSPFFLVIIRPHSPSNFDPLDLLFHTLVFALKSTPFFPFPLSHKLLSTLAFFKGIYVQCTCIFPYSLFSMGSRLFLPGFSWTPVLKKYFFFRIFPFPLSNLCQFLTPALPFPCKVSTLSLSPLPHNITSFTLLSPIPLTRSQKNKGYSVY